MNMTHQEIVKYLHSKRKRETSLYIYTMFSLLVLLPILIGLNILNQKTGEFTAMIILISALVAALMGLLWHVTAKIQGIDHTYFVVVNSKGLFDKGVKNESQHDKNG